MMSLTRRLLVSTGLVLTIFVVLTGLSISYSVHKRAETALFDRLQGLVYGILGATEIDSAAQLFVNEAALPDPALNQTTAGLAAEIIGVGGVQLWQSRSTTQHMPETVLRPIGDWAFATLEQSDNTRLHRLQLSTAWELDNGEELPFIVHVVATDDVLSGSLRRFDRSLWATLAGSALCLLLLQLWVLHQSLKPLNGIGEELDAIEGGSREALSENVPRELHPLARSINTLLKSERNRHTQYRNLLDDLAHSLKTPLSVLRNVRGDNNAPAIIDEQTQLMQNTVDRYLQRAALRSPQLLAPPLSPLPVIHRLSDSLSKLHQSRHPAGTIDFRCALPEMLTVRVAEADLFEILGNLLENASKYGASDVHIHTGEKGTPAMDAQRDPTNRPMIVIDDNGPGFPDDNYRRLGQRGVRADTAVSGQGLGLAASRELLESYGGSLTLGSSPSGGARVTLTFP